MGSKKIIFIQKQTRNFLDQFLPMSPQQRQQRRRPQQPQGFTRTTRLMICYNQKAYLMTSPMAFLHCLGVQDPLLILDLRASTSCPTIAGIGVASMSVR